MALRKDSNLYQEVQNLCLEEYGTPGDPVRLLERAWENPDFPMHCPEHHFLVSAVLLTCYRALQNATPLKLREDLAVAEERGKGILAGFCGWYGACGAAVGSGVFLSILTDTSPYSKESWGLVNLLTSSCLHEIALMGGPRCCKRVSFTSVKTTVAFMAKHLDMEIGPLAPIRCGHFEKNAECLKDGCPYYSRS